MVSSRIVERGGLLEQHVLQLQESECDKRRYAWNRAHLQALGNLSAKMILRAMSGQERQFLSYENHRISKTIVNTEFVVFARKIGQIGKNRFMDKGTRNKLNT
jgi:putative transposase